MPKALNLFLDVETECTYENGWIHELTVVGFRSSKTGVVQLVGDEITAGRLRRLLPKRGRLFTFGGHSFDLPRIRRELRLDLHDRFDCCDLLQICRSNRIKGDQKKSSAAPVIVGPPEA